MGNSHSKRNEGTNRTPELMPQIQGSPPHRITQEQQAHWKPNEKMIIKKPQDPASGPKPKPYTDDKGTTTCPKNDRNRSELPALATVMSAHPTKPLIKGVIVNGHLVRTSYSSSKRHKSDTIDSTDPNTNSPTTLPPIPVPKVSIQRPCQKRLTSKPEPTSTNLKSGIKQHFDGLLPRIYQIDSFLVPFQGKDMRDDLIHR